MNRIWEGQPMGWLFLVYINYYQFYSVFERFSCYIMLNI